MSETYYSRNKDKIDKKHKEYYEKNKEKIREYQRNYVKRNKNKINKQINEKIKEKKILVFNHYTNGKNQCQCCGENEFLFLSIDHIDNNGAEHRREIGKGYSIYFWLVENDFPEGFQVYCMNCNWGKARNGGICPHNNK
ncbi:hypothetical protein [Nitrosopumilus sp.]|uniref:hypothetical protein n=1 Tax=Nitrosopumilus sp. TaxID=2024843 RepID=UPI003D12BFC5